jgi:hypothetical protein
MKLENQVCSLELAKRLKELGVKQDSLFCWTTDLDIEFLPTDIRNDHVVIAAFTVAELGEMLPKEINGFFFTQIPTINNEWYLFYRHAFSTMNLDNEEIYSDDENEANARAKMLIYLIENDLIKKE